MKKIFGIIFIMVVFSTPVYAADWVLVCSEDVLSMYLDEESIQVEKNSQNHSIIFDCWVKFEYTEPTEDGIKYSLMEIEFQAINNWNNAYYRPREYLCYDSDGNLLDSTHGGGSWVRIPPESKMEATYRKVVKCKYGKK